MLSVIFGILSAVCLVYFGIIAVYSGIKTSAAWIWLVLAVVFFLLFRGNMYYHQHKKQVPLWVPVSIATLCAAGTVILVILQVLIFGGMFRTAPDHLDYLIVLGARVREDDISASLKHRLDKAIRFAQEHPETKLILSGGQGEGEPTSEAQAMAEYLMYNGIAREQMLLESYSTNTKENMICSKALIDAQRKLEKEMQQRARIQEGRRRMELSWFLLKLEEDAFRKETLDEGETGQRERIPAGQKEGKQAMIERDYDPQMQSRREMTRRFRESLARGDRYRQRSYGPGQDMAAASAGGQNFEALIQVYPGMTELLPDKPLQVGVLTSNFHLYRAMKIGEKCGFEHLYGVASSSDPVLFIHLCIREGIAIVKDKFMGNM